MNQTNPSRCPLFLSHSLSLFAKCERVFGHLELVLFSSFLWIFSSFPFFFDNLFALSTVIEGKARRRRCCCWDLNYLLQKDLFTIATQIWCSFGIADEYLCVLHKYTRVSVCAIWLQAFQVLLWLSLRMCVCVCVYPRFGFYAQQTHKNDGYK